MTELARLARIRDGYEQSVECGACRRERPCTECRGWRAAVEDWLWEGVVELESNA